MSLDELIDASYENIGLFGKGSDDDDNNRKKIRRKKMPGSRNVLQALGSGAAESIPEIQEDLPPFDVFRRTILNTKFYIDNLPKANKFTVFAPDNQAMTTWFRAIKVVVFLEGATSVIVSGVPVFPMDIEKTIDKFNALPRPYYNRYITILLAHFLSGVRPLFTGLERGPQPLDLWTAKIGLVPITNVGVDTEWVIMSDILPSPEWFLKKYARDKKPYESIRIVRAFRTSGEKTPDGLLDSGFRVKFFNGAIDGEIINEKSHIKRPNNGYIYRIGEVLARTIDLPPVENFKPPTSTPAPPGIVPPRVAPPPTVRPTPPVADTLTSTKDLLVQVSSELHAIGPSAKALPGVNHRPYHLAAEFVRYSSSQASGLEESKQRIQTLIASAEEDACRLLLAVDAGVLQFENEDHERQFVDKALAPYKNLCALDAQIN